MISALRFFSREVRGMHQAAYILAAFSLASQILALGRDRLLAAVFGAGHTLDMYYAAFRIPDFLFATVASLFSLYALLPILTRMSNENEGKMVLFLRYILLVFFLGMSIVSIIAYALVPSLIPIVAPGIAHDPASHAELILLMRILLLQPILLGASNTIASLTQLRHRFILYSISPLLYNLGIIFGALVLFPYMGVAGLGWGVVLGALMHFLIQVPYFFSEKPVGQMSLSTSTKAVLEVLVLSVPRTLALASTQISLLFLTAIASFLVPGSITVLSFALNLQAVPLTIIGVSYSVAAFPTLARLHASGARAEFTSYVEAALRHIIFWGVPATVFVIVLRAQIVRLILGAGQFDWGATRLTAAALALLITSLISQSATLLIARTYYAIGNTKKPFYFGLADITLSIAGALFFSWMFTHNMYVRFFVESLLRVDDVPGTAILMLSLGYACGAIAEALIGYLYFARDFGIIGRDLRVLTMQSFAASVLGSAVAYYVLLILTPLFGEHTLGIALEGLLAGSFGMLVTIGILKLLKNRELDETMGALMRRFRDAPQVALEPTDVASAQ